LRRLFKRTFAEARAVIAVSDELAARAEPLGASVERLHVIPGGVPYVPLAPRLTARASLGIPAETLCVLWVGGLVPVKQPLDAVEAFSHLAAELRNESVILVMIGDGPLMSKVRTAVRERNLHDAVRLPGYLARERVWQWHCAADVLVNSSRSEGTPRAVLEALGAGTAVVGYSVGGIPAAVGAVDGGRVAADKNPHALAASIADELLDRRDRESLARRARKRFGIREATQAIEAVYDKVT
jgi:glycosyltransferase involved in cell wall biosynthesis